MPTFEVTAYRSDDPTVVVEDNNPDTWPRRYSFTRVGMRPELVVDDLISEGYQPIAVRPVERIKAWKPRFREEKAVLYRHLARALQRRVPRIEYARVLSDIFEEKSKFRQPANDFLAACADKDFYRAMEAQPEIFEEYEVNLLQIGAGGKEADMFTILADSLSVENRMQKRIASVLSWPGIVLMAVVVMIWVFMYKLLPKLIDAMQAGASDQTNTDAVVDKLVFPLGPLYHFSIFLTNPINDVILVIALASIVGVVYMIFKHTPPLRYITDALVLSKTKALGNILRLNRENKLLHVLHLLLRGEQQLDAYDIACSSAVGEVAIAGMKRAAESFRNGGLWSEHLREVNGIFSNAHCGRLVAAESSSGVPGIIEEMEALIAENNEDIDQLIGKFEKQLMTGSSVLLFGLVYGLFSVMIFPLQHQITMIK